jgi:hypothetical protein
MVPDITSISSLGGLGGLSGFGGGGGSETRRNYSQATGQGEPCRKAEDYFCDLRAPSDGDQLSGGITGSFAHEGIDHCSS